MGLWVLLLSFPSPAYRCLQFTATRPVCVLRARNVSSPCYFYVQCPKQKSPWTMETSWVYYISILYQLQKLHQPFWLKKEHGKDLKKAVFSLHLLGKTWYMGERDRWRLHSVTGNRFWGFDVYDSTHNKYKGYSKIQSYNQWKSVSWHWERILYFALGKPENMQKYKEYILVIL